MVIHFEDGRQTWKPVVDAHEDLAYHCHEYSRDLVDPGECESMITLPGLLDSGMRLICGTLFTAHGQPEDIRAARLLRQYEQYQHWFQLYPNALWPVRSRSELQALKQARSRELLGRQAYPIGVILLMEGLDLLAGPADLQLWWERGLRVASLTWDGPNRFASGRLGNQDGITDEGWSLLREFQQLGMILDVSHLNDSGIADAVSGYAGGICASHSNMRALCSHERNLTDEFAVQIAARGGVIGLNLLANFIREGWRQGMELPTVSEAASHVLRIVDLCGAMACGLGTDLDGGLTRLNTPEGIDRITDLPLLYRELERGGLSAAQLDGFKGINWWKFFELRLPA